MCNPLAMIRNSVAIYKKLIGFDQGHIITEVVRGLKQYLFIMPGLMKELHLLYMLVTITKK